MTLIKTDHKTAQIRAAVHLPVSHTSISEVLHVRIGSDHDLGAAHVNVEDLEIRDDSIVEHVRGFLATVFALVQELLMELGHFEA